MGLATSYSIVKRHDGLLTVDSRPGRGTTCRIYVPASEDQTETAPVEVTRTGVRMGRILVMDDERAILNLMGKALKREGHAVELARDGAEAVSLYSQHMSEGRTFDLVIMDLTIPGGMGGKEALKMLKKMDPNVRAIVASGYSNDPVVANYRKYGFCGCIRKPFTADDLLGAVDGALSGAPDA
jgi:DNA-binding NtrC family response regulator